jgi:1,4-dihydroxy-2-naphthoate octaprenyltransferase
MVIEGISTGRILFALVSYELLTGFAVSILVFWSTMLADCALHETSANNEMLVWIIIIIFAPIIGALIYYYGRRPLTDFPPGELSICWPTSHDC